MAIVVHFNNFSIEDRVRSKIDAFHSINTPLGFLFEARLDIGATCFHIDSFQRKTYF